MGRCYVAGRGAARTSNSARALSVSLVRGEGFVELWTLTPDGARLVHCGRLRA